MNTWHLARALLFLQTRSFANAAKVRVRRLKQPKYLIGAVVGLSYLYFWFGRAVLGSWRSSGNLPVLSESSQTILQGAAAMVLAIVVAAQWIFTGSRAALQFSETELAFLLPAPLSRRMLIRYKLIRGQLGTLISAGVLTLFTGRFAADGRVLFHVLGWWLALTLLNLHSLGASFTVQRLTERGLSTWARRGLALGVVGLLVGLVALWIRALPTMPGWRGDPRALAGDFGHWAELALTTGPGPWILAPFRWAVAPWFAPNLREFLRALVPVSLMLGLLYRWVERNDVAFEEASLGLSEKRAQLIAQARDLKRTGLQAPKSLLPSPFPLASVGPPAVALLWKNLIAARATPRTLAWITGAVVVLSLAARWSPLPEAVRITFCGLALLTLAVFTLIGGTQTSLALRRDLGMLEVLRGYPLPGWQMVLGELLGPALVTFGIQGLGTLAALLTLPASEDGSYTGATVLAAGIATLIIVAPLNLVNALIPSAATLLFPAWSKPGRDLQQPGFEALGQRLVFSLAQIAVMLLTLAPAVVVGGGAFLAVGWILGPSPAVLAAGMGAATVLAVESWFGVRLLGRLFDQYDASIEQS